MSLLVSALGFAVLLVLPLIPGLIELLRPQDDERLEIDQSYAREPRFFGRSLRNKLQPFIEQAPKTRPYFMEITLRRTEQLALHDDFRAPAGAAVEGIVIAQGAASVGAGSKLGEVYAMRSADIKERVQMRAIACDGDLVLAEGCRIERWLDAEGGIWAGPRCELGRSASAAGVFHVLDGCTFSRLWGLPVSTKSATPSLEETKTIEDVVIFGEQGLGLPRNCTLDQDLVVRGVLRVGAGSVVRGNIKVHGDVSLGAGVRVEGNIVARGNVTVFGDAVIDGNIFSEGDVVIGPKTRIGDRDSFKSVYAAGTVRLFNDVLVHGWIVAERGGRIG